jgi:phage terminase small subunit
MPVLTNAKHERFAQELAAGKTADEAYEAAGYAQNRGNAIRLKANESVAARVAELQQRAADGVVLTRQWVIEQLIDNVTQAKKSGEKIDGATANRALELLGKELGMFVERVENTNVNYAISGEPVDSVEDWAEQYAPKH